MFPLFKKRKIPFEIRFVFILLSDCIIKTPEAFTLALRNNVEPQRQESVFTNWESNITKKPRQIELSLSCNVRPGDFAPGQYEEYQKLMRKAVKKSMTIDVECKK